MMKVCLLGPGYPYRGGIAHYTTLLAKALRVSGHQVVFFGFTRQFPRWLYPGQTDQDPSQSALKDDYIRVLDTLNPVTWMRTARRIRQEQPQVLIIPWWTSFLSLPFFTVVALVRRTRSIQVVFICHNVVEHETNLLKQSCARQVLKLGDAFIVHSSEDRRRLEAMIPGAPVCQASHPTYRDLVSIPFSREAARQRLGIEGNVLLFFGFVRPYKGLEFAICSLPLILKEHQVTLIVAGEFWSGKEQILNLIANLNVGRHVQILDQYIPNEEVGLYFAAADLLLLPYVSATQSGIAQIAYSQGVPVVATRVGGFIDVVTPEQTGYLVEPQSPEAIAEAVIDFFNRDRRPDMVRQIKAVRSEFTWEPIVNIIEGLADHPQLRHRGH